MIYEVITLKSILLSIHPEYVENILEGIKKYEYRKRLASDSIKYIYIYSTSPVMKIVAKADVLDILEDSPMDLWERTKENSGISKYKFHQYFEGRDKAYAYKLGDIEIFAEPKRLQDFGVNAAPQSFVYIREELFVEEMRI